VEALERSRTREEPLAEALRGLSNEELLQRIQQYANENRASRLNQADALLKDLSQSKEGEV
jgi:dTDP-4-dehydrorhamnose reductase